MVCEQHHACRAHLLAVMGDALAHAHSSSPHHITCARVYVMCCLHLLQRFVFDHCQTCWELFRGWQSRGRTCQMWLEEDVWAAALVRSSLMLKTWLKRLHVLRKFLQLSLPNNVLRSVFVLVTVQSTWARSLEKVPVCISVEWACTPWSLAHVFVKHSSTHIVLSVIVFFSLSTLENHFLEMSRWVIKSASESMC